MDRVFSIDKFKETNQALYDKVQSLKNETDLASDKVKLEGTYREIHSGG